MSDFKRNIFLLAKEWKKVPISFAIDKYLIRKDIWIIKMLSDTYQYLYPKLFFFFLKFAHLKVSAVRSKVQVGKYEFMRTRITLFQRNNQLWIAIDGKEFPLRKSLFWKSYYFVKASTLAFQADSSVRLNLLLGDGNIRAYSYLGSSIK
jgi:hypothetical protein